jgi:hypothetical protein
MTVIDVAGRKEKHTGVYRVDCLIDWAQTDIK